MTAPAKAHAASRRRGVGRDRRRAYPAVGAASTQGIDPVGAAPAAHLFPAEPRP